METSGICGNCLKLQTMTDPRLCICSCGKSIDIPFAIKIVDFVRLLGEGTVNSAFAAFTNEKLDSSVLIKDSHLKLKSGSKIVINLPSVIEKASFVSSGYINERTVFQEGLFVLKELVRKRKIKLLEETGKELNTFQVVSILESTFLGEHSRGNPKFGHTVVQNLGPEFQDKEFLLDPSLILRHEVYDLYPVMADHKDIPKGINEGGIKAFKKMHKLHFFGKVEVRYIKLPNARVDCYVIGITPIDDQTILVIPGIKRVYIFNV